MSHAHRLIQPLSSGLWSDCVALRRKLQKILESDRPVYRSRKIQRIPERFEPLSFVLNTVKPTLYTVYTDKTTFIVFTNLKTIDNRNACCDNYLLTYEY